MTTRTQPTGPGGGVRVVFLAALVAVLTTLFATATASAATGAEAETRVRASVEPATVLVGPPEHISAGQQLGNSDLRVVHAVATGVAAKSGDEGVDLFRHVSPGELEDIGKNGFRPGAGSLDGKWFAESGEHANEWGRVLNGGNGSVVRVRVPTPFADQPRCWAAYVGLMTSPCRDLVYGADRGLLLADSVGGSERGEDALVVGGESQGHGNARDDTAAVSLRGSDDRDGGSFTWDSELDVSPLYASGLDALTVRDTPRGIAVIGVSGEGRAGVAGLPASSRSYDTALDLVRRHLGPDFSWVREEWFRERGVLGHDAERYQAAGA